MFLATLAGSASGAERSSVLRADGRRLCAVDERLDGSADGRGRSTGLADDGNDGGLLDGGLFEFSERADRVAAGLRDLDAVDDRNGLRDLDADDDRNGLRFDGNGRERRLSVAKRRVGERCERGNERRLRERLRRRLLDRRALLERLLDLRRRVDDLRRNGV